METDLKKKIVTSRSLQAWNDFTVWHRVFRVPFVQSSLDVYIYIYIYIYIPLLRLPPFSSGYIYNLAV